jgi:hypothetical protein
MSIEPRCCPGLGVDDGLGAVVGVRHVHLADVGVVGDAVGKASRRCAGDDLVRRRVDGGDLVGPGRRRVETVQVGREAEAVHGVEVVDGGDDVETGGVDHVDGAVAEVRDVEPLSSGIDVLVVEPGRATG